MDTPPLDQHREPSSESIASLPRIPPATIGYNQEVQTYQIDNLLPGYFYLHAPLPCAQFFNVDAYALDSQHNKDYNRDMLTDKGTSSG